MILTLVFIIVGAFGSAIFTTGWSLPSLQGHIAVLVDFASSCLRRDFHLPAGFGDDIWTRLVMWRFVLGIGVGGTYPLTAVFAGEMSDDRGLGRTSRVAYSIAMQIAGNVAAPVRPIASTPEDLVGGRCSQSKNQGERRKSNPLSSADRPMETCDFRNAVQSPPQRALCTTL